MGIAATDGAKGMQSQFSHLLMGACMSMLLAHANAQGFDFFYFVLQWPGSYCDTSSSCCYPTTGKPASDFSIHGLWPNYNNGGYPSSCDPNNPFDISQVSDIESQLQTSWDSLSCPSSDGTSFWTHEWDKHGTCAESLFSQHAYFQSALNLRSSVNPLGGLSAAGINPDDGAYSLTAIQNALTSSLGHTPGVQCSSDASGNNQLYQLYICVATDASTLIDCPVFPTSGCSSTVLFPSF
ncbi:hypothetical protein O6H91_11G120200 [Diphasiastrum complanatum]|uniref:Uncharacterized protein n=2 Tax=Diphasiastrum complanatum TaxID=34168 RepID=A0ACC2CDC1_DIPCM|nr:hypothetical protein O6H91_11G119500 [Diphasiastrum complanatum]KAJ7540052.1 hypothetical protein O6H91_11G120200 [Diphasiastrum complanatum]